MRYKESQDDLTDDPALTEGYEELELEKEEDELDLLVGDPAASDAEKRKLQAGSRFSLKARRAIEDHLEEKRLRKELDYLLDEDATSNDKKDL